MIFAAIEVSQALRDGLIILAPTLAALSSSSSSPTSSSGSHALIMPKFV
jgi:hypothetical protein